MVWNILSSFSDPKLVEFIKSRRRPDREKELPGNEKDDAIGEDALKNFSHLRNTEWLHMDVEEPEKFSWMSQLPDSVPNVEVSSEVNIFFIRLIHFNFVL